MKKDLLIPLIFLSIAACFFAPFLAPGQDILFILIQLSLAAFLIKTRAIKERPTRAAILIVAGLASFWLSGASLVQSDISLDPIPLFVFALSTVQAALIAYTFSPSEGITFGAMGFALVAGAFNFGRGDLPIFEMAIDKLLLIAIIVSISEAIWAWLVGNSEGLKNSFFAVGKASLIASALNFLSFNIQYSSFSLATRVTWFYFLSHAVLISLFILLHEFVTNTYSLRREVTEAGAKYRKKLRVEEVFSEEEEMRDPFEDLISDMEAYKESPPKNKLESTQQLNRFRNEFRVLSSKYDTASKRKAEMLLEELGD